jgi:drug/metabolite transporter (DMT)-like permease
LLLVGGPVFAWLQFAAYRYAPLAHGAIIHPPTVTILSTVAAAVFLKERISAHHVAGTALVVSGIVLLGWDGVVNTTEPRARDRNLPHRCSRRPCRALRRLRPSAHSVRLVPQPQLS